MVNITNIDPNTLTLQTISPEDVAIIPNFDITSSFNPVIDRVEYFVYDFNNNLLSSNNDLRSYKPSSIDPTGSIIDIVLFPEEDIVKAGYSTGIVKSIYNFISPQVGSADNPLFISEISPSRTELRLSSNNNLLFDTSDLINTTFLSGSAYELYTEFRQNVENSNYLDEFYLNFGNNIYVIGVNSVLEYNSQNNTISLLIKLYEPLPTSIGLKTELSVVTKRAESVAYQIDFTQEETILDSTIKLSGPNYNIPIKDETGPLTQYQNYSSITSTSLSGSLFQLMNQISASSIDINVDYTDYEDFIFFSSAYQRLYNFKEKVTKISSSQAQLDLLYSNITGPTSASVVVSSSKLLLEKEIETTITSFDGYEYFLYYTSGSYAWPKSNAQAPYTLYPPTSTQAINWYATQSAVAVEYDENNQNNLEYVVPEYIRFNSSNTNYMLFTNMIGQFFDEIWLYTKAITAKLDANSNLYQGVSKDVVSTVLESLGTKIYDSTYTLENIYSSLIGLSANGALYPTTGSQLVTNYITASVSSPEDIPTIDDFVRLSYKKIYNALPYLLKKKGTNAGLRSLINIFGIPDTILQINEFGGKNKVGNNDWDYWQDKFNYKLDIDGSDGSFVDIPWSINSTWGAESNVPNTLQFRFKTLGLDSAIARPSQSLWNLDNTGDTAIVLEYTGSGYLSGSYSGSIPSGSNEYATLKFIPNYTGDPTVSASIYLPFYDGGWWSVMVTRDDEDFVLYAANKIYNGDDGFIIGYTGSSTVNTVAAAWAAGTNAYFGANGTLTIGSKSYVNFSGSYQEVRYYNTILPSGTFYDYTMNPYSIEGVGINGAYDQLAFRGTLGNDLYTSSKSMHPKITGSYITQSFASNSNFTINNGTFSVNKEFVFQDQIPAGMRNAVSKKIKNISTTLPYSGSEEVNLPVNTVLSPFIPIDQDSYNSSSYVEDVKYVEVVFSPQNEINEDINAQIGYFNIGDYIGDPRLVSSSAETYPELDALSKDYFDKYYSNYNLWDYIRLIRYYDNALFKMVKDYVPVRSSVTTGVLIKQHILERNKYPVPQLDTYTTTSFYGSGSSTNPAWNTPFVFQNLEITGSPIQMYTISGSTGGTMPDLFGLTSSEFTGNNVVNITQSWDGINSTPLGLVPFVDSTQMEFYDGELSGSYIQVEDGDLNPDNPYKLASTQLLVYDTFGQNTANNPSAGGIFWHVNTGYDGFAFYLYVDALYINETSKNGVDIESALNNLNAGNKITFTVEFDLNSTTYTRTVTGTIASISPQSQTVRKITFLGGTLSTTTIFYFYTLGDPFAYADAFDTNVILDPFLNVASGFEYSSFNPLIDNAVISRPNFDYFDVDFSSNAITAVNKNTIITASRGSGSATPSTTPASNYTIARSANPRYNGSRTSSPTGSRYQSFVNQPMNFGSSIGQVTNVESYCDWFAVFDNISPSFLAYELYIGGTQVSSITVASAVHVTTLIDINGNTIDLSPTNNIIPSSSLFGILDNKVNPLTSNIPLLNSIFPSNIYSGYISAGTASLDTPVSIRQYSFTGSSNVSSGSFKNYQVFSSGAQPDEDTVGPYTFQNIYGKPNETIVLLATGSFITPTGNINGLLVPGNFNPEYSANLLEIAQSAGFFKNV
jgi:hypothetical protein